MLILLYVLTGFTALVTLMPLSRRKEWWIRGWDFPRAQIALLAAVAFIGFVFREDRFSGGTTIGAAIALCVFLYQAGWILPYTRLYRKEVCDAPDGPERIRLLSANVLQTNRETTRLKRMLVEHEPDIFLALEADKWWADQLAFLKDRMPHTLQCPLDNLYGMLLFSRWPLEDGKIQFLVEDDKPSMHAAVRLPDGRIFRLVCLHPAPPSPTENEKSTERDAELILIARNVAKETRPALVVGDLNDVAWSRTTRLFRKISCTLDPRVGRGLYNTFHARYVFLRWPVDHLFHTKHFTLARLQRLGAFGSDHYPVLAELVLANGEQNDEALPEDDGDRDEARKETRAVGESPDKVHVPRG